MLLVRARSAHWQWTLVLGSMAALAGCSPTNSAADAAPDVVVDASEPDVVLPPVHDPADCDPLDETECAMPWPSNLYLVPDPTRRTGYTLAFGRSSLPENTANRTVDPSPYRRLDGYGVGTPLIVRFPNLDISGLATEDHIERSMAADAPILWFEVDAGGALRRVPYWVELDATEEDPARKVLFVRPAVILNEATRYVVAFRNLRDTRGEPLAPSPAFARLRDRRAASDERLAPRIARFEEVFAMLESQGIARESLTLAWDFVTASDEALHGRMLFMRDDALRRTGPEGPPLEVTSVTEFVPADDGSGRPVNPYIALEMHGTFEAPHYLRPRIAGYRGWEFNLGPDGMPLANGTHTAEFWVRIPRSAVDGSGVPHGLVEYGHGLLGQGTEVRASYNDKIAYDHHLIFFATTMVGMSSEDAPLLPRMLSDMSLFVWMGDRLHQGVLEHLLLARAMRARFASLPQVRARGIVVDSDQIYYSGISQGGIFGATIVALSPDIQRGHLGVPGNNYSTLLQRSTDFRPFFQLLQTVYERASNRAVLLSTVQLLWDGTEPVSYYRHLSASPFPGNAPHHVLLAPARGDHQVAVVTNEVLARTTEIGIPLLAHYDTERMPFGTTPLDYPHMGSGIVLYSFGNPWPSPGNHVPEDSMPDPHGSPRRQDWHNEQMVHFFRTGEIIDVCGGDGCTPR